MVIEHPTDEVKLYYFDCYGRAESIRMLLHSQGVAFEDVRMDYELFLAYKEQGKFEFGFCPSLEMNGKQYCQSNAILRLLGRKYGLLPTADREAW